MYRLNKYLLIFTLFTAGMAGAQNNSSPYSIVGIGDIESGQFNRTSGMAGTGLAYRTPLNIITNNPAAHSALAPGRIMMEAALRGRFVTYSGAGVTAENGYSKDLTIRRLVIGTRFNKWWGSSFGLAPFSTSNYLFTGQKTIQGTSTNMPALYEGSGGVNQLYWANGLSLGKHLSLGVHAAFLFGSLNQSETIAEASSNFTVNTARNVYLRNYHFTYGLQYEQALSKNWSLVVGGTYAPRTRLRATYDLTVTQGSDSVISSNVLKRDFFSLPQSIGAGLALRHRERLTVSTDLKYQAWSQLRYKGSNYSLTDTREISLGAEYAIRKAHHNLVFESAYFQAGAHYRQSYLQIYGTQITDQGISFGLGKNFRNNLMGVSVGMDVGTRGSSTQRLIRERYTQLHITCSLKEFLSGKTRYVD